MGGFLHGAAIEASLALLGDRVGDPAPLVYARLFAEHPATQPLFCNDASGAVRGEMLARSFEAILDYVGDRHWADHLIRSERLAHDGYGVPPALFLGFFETLAATTRAALGADWTADMAVAWDALVADIAVTSAI